MTNRDVKPASLPQKRQDPYANVNPQDFSTAAKLTVEQSLAMADIAMGQGLPGVSMRWKAVATDKVARQERKAQADRMVSGWNPKPMPPAGTPVIEVQTDGTPWGEDPRYRKLAAKHRKARKKLEATGQADPKINEIRDAASAAKDAMDARKDEVAAEALRSGRFTEQNERVAAARQSLVEKAARVAKQVRR